MILKNILFLILGLSSQIAFCQEKLNFALENFTYDGKKEPITENLGKIFAEELAKTGYFIPIQRDLEQLEKVDRENKRNGNPSNIQNIAKTRCNFTGNLEKKMGQLEFALKISCSDLATTQEFPLTIYINRDSLENDKFCSNLFRRKIEDFLQSYFTDIIKELKGKNNGYIHYQKINTKELGEGVLVEFGVKKQNILGFTIYILFKNISIDVKQIEWWQNKPNSNQIIYPYPHSSMSSFNEIKDNILLGMKFKEPSITTDTSLYLFIKKAEMENIDKIKFSDFYDKLLNFHEN